MNGLKHPRVLPRLAVAMALAALCAGPAQASLLSPVSVSLLAPGGIFGVPGAISVTDVVPTASGIVVGDPSQIGSTYMLPGESILFSGNSILLTLASGAFDGTNWITGYLGLGADHARYEFDNLAIAGQTITGINLLAGGAVIGGAAAALTAPGQVTFNLDSLTFNAPAIGQSYSYGDFTIELLTQPNNNNVPEPASWALALVALAALRCRPRRSAAGPADAARQA